MGGLPSVSELLESAFGDGYKSVIVALVVGYLFAACVVFRYPSPFRARVGGALKKTKEGGRGGGDGAGTNAGTGDGDDSYPVMPKGDLTVGELRRYDGSDRHLPVLVAAKGRVYDVSKGRDYYGKGGPYNCFAGIDCSRALAKVSLDAKDLNADCADLHASERDVLNDWVAKFESKYPFVGLLTNGTYNGAS